MLFKKKSYTDADLIRGCIKNNRRYQERLYKKYFKLALSCVQPYTSDKEEVLSIINQGFLKVFQNIHQVKDSQSLGNWIKTIMQRTRVDAYRNQRKYLEHIVLEMPLQQTNKETTTTQLYVKDIIHFLDQLPPSSAEVFRQYAIEGFKHKEIARNLGISEGTSKWHLSAAREKLKQLINNHYNNHQKNIG